MIHVEPTSLDQIDLGVLTPLACEEFGDAAAEGHQSKSVWAVRNEEEPILFVGTIERGLLSSPEFWVLLCNEFVAHVLTNLRSLRSLVSEYRAAHGSFTSIVREEHLRFAQFLGMEPMYRMPGGWIRVRV